MSAADLRCDCCDSPLEIEDLRCPICNRATPLTTPKDSPEAAVEVMRCDGCGAAVTYSVRELAPSCAFCGSVTRLEVPEDPLDQTEYFLPLTVHRDDAVAAYKRWQRSLGWFMPSDLGSASSLEALTPLWWVGWVFSADATVSWTADSDFGARRAEWAPHAGQVELEFDDIVVPASRGLSVEETDCLADSYDLDSAGGEPVSGGRTTIVERFDVPRSTARQRVASMLGRLARTRLEDDHIPGSRFRNVHTSILLRRLVTRRFAFPSYVLAYRYRGKLYRIVISGQDD
ncbi:MAG: hypothetical protein ACC742_13035, partial [Thermoanaerobaculales bacterium]